jgi:predicted dehydrogenase
MDVPQGIQMTSNQGFRDVAADPGERTVNVGLLGYGFMAKAHSNAYKTMPYIFWPPPARPHLRAIAGRTESRVAEAARRYGYDGYYTSWEELVADPDIELFDNCASHHMHVEPSIAALRNGKHVICEKPMALSASEARRMLEAAREAGLQHMCGFNYRFVPAIRLARDLIDKGLLGDIYHLRVQYLQQSLHDPERPLGRLPDPAAASAGSQAILGSHAVDLARFLVGEFGTVSALTPRFLDRRPGPGGAMVDLTWDDATVALVEFTSGAVGTVEASRVATGRANALRFEINGSAGTVAFDLERLNELQVYLREMVVPEAAGFRNVLVTGANYANASVWWPGGHILGWEHAHINELHHFIEAIVTGTPVGPYGATFDDGYRAAVIAEAMDESARSGRRADIVFEE